MLGQPTPSASESLHCSHQAKRVITAVLGTQNPGDNQASDPPSSIVDPRTQQVSEKKPRCLDKITVIRVGIVQVMKVAAWPPRPVHFGHNMQQ